MNKTLRSFLVVAFSLPITAYSGASPTVYPDVGAQREVRREVQVVFSAPAATRVSAVKNTAKRARLEAKLKALGIAVD